MDQLNANAEERRPPSSCIAPLRSCERMAAFLSDKGVGVLRNIRSGRCVRKAFQTPPWFGKELHGALLRYVYKINKIKKKITRTLAKKSVDEVAQWQHARDHWLEHMRLSRPLVKATLARVLHPPPPNHPTFLFCIQKIFDANSGHATFTHPATLLCFSLDWHLKALWVRLSSIYRRESCNACNVNACFLMFSHTSCYRADVHSLWLPLISYWSVNCRLIISQWQYAVFLSQSC